MSFMEADIVFGKDNEINQLYSNNLAGLNIQKQARRIFVDVDADRIIEENVRSLLKQIPATHSSPRRRTTSESQVFWCADWSRQSKSAHVWSVLPNQTALGAPEADEAEEVEIDKKKFSSRLEEQEELVLLRPLKAEVYLCILYQVNWTEGKKIRSSYDYITNLISARRREEIAALFLNANPANLEPMVCAAFLFITKGSPGLQGLRSQFLTKVAKVLPDKLPADKVIEFLQSIA